MDTPNAVAQAYIQTWNETDMRRRQTYRPDDVRRRRSGNQQPDHRCAPASRRLPLCAAVKCSNADTNKQ